MRVTRGCYGPCHPDSRKVRDETAAQPGHDESKLRLHCCVRRCLRPRSPIAQVAPVRRAAPASRRRRPSSPTTAWWWRRRARRPHRRRDPRPRRQRGRRRGRGRLRAGGDLSARRQSRRRRLHGDPSRQRQSRCRDRLSRDRAGGDDARHVPRRAGQADPAKSRDSALCRRRARHRRRPGAGAREIRLRQIHARRSDRAGDRSRAQGLPGRRRSRRLAAAARERLARWPSSAAIFLKRRPAAARRATGWCSPISPIRWRPSRDDGPRAFYEGRIAEQIAAAVREAGGIMTHGRSRELSRRRAPGRARQLSRLRHRVDAAAVLRRRASDRDAQHSGRLSTRQDRPGAAGAASR